jgi:hypothetical protein
MTKKSFIIRACIAVIAITVILMTGSSMRKVKVEKVIPTTVCIDSAMMKMYIAQRTDQLFNYLHALSLLESNGDPTARRSGSGYIGNYQIGNSARQVIGLGQLNNEGNYQVMLNDSFLQDMIMLRLLQANVSEMREYFKKYNNTKRGGWYITNSGILAMTHLMGGGNTKDFLDKGIISHDGNGRPITDYLQLNNFNIFIDSIATGGYIKNILAKVKIK